MNRRSTPRDISVAAGAIHPKLSRSSAIPAPAADRGIPAAEIYDETVGIIFNSRAHRNARFGFRFHDASPGVLRAAPTTKLELDHTLAFFAERKLSTLVIDGGDGTVSDVLCRIHRHFEDSLPKLAIVPSGKTNAIALDLGIPPKWTVSDALQAGMHGKFVQRSPLEICFDGKSEPQLRGFLFGAGAFVRATALAQGVHRAGAFNGVAIGLSLAAAIGQTLFGRRENAWRRGDPMLIELPDGQCAERNFYLLMGTTLERLPLGLKPFGRVRSGLKLLGVDAPPRNLALCVPALLAGLEKEWMDARGYHRADVERFSLRLTSSIVLDGEVHEGGDMTISRGAPVDFLVPTR